MHEAARPSLQVGALVGRVAAGRDLILQAIRAPERVSACSSSDSRRGGRCVWD